MRARQKAREFFSTLFFWISFVKGDFEKRIFQKYVRACVRPSAQKPIALESVDFASPKWRVSKVPLQGGVSNPSFPKYLEVYP